MRLSVTVAALMLSILLTANANADLITNGGFETGDLTGWSSNGGNWVEPSNFLGVAPHSGNFVLDYGAVGTVSMLYQTIATTPGELYTFSFWQKTCGGTPNEFQAYWGNTMILDLVNSPIASQYTQYTFTEMATGTSTLVEFGLRQDPAWSGLDDVSVVAGAPVPEPPPALLLAAGCLGLLFVSRKLRAGGPGLPA